MRGLDEVLEDVLPVAGPVPQPAEQGEQLRVYVGQPDLHHRVLGRPQAQPLDLVPGEVEYLLDAVRVDPPVEDQLLQREPADLPAYRIKARQQYRLGRVVDDEIDTRH